MQRQIFHPCKLSGGFWGHFTSIYQILEWDIPYNCMKISCMFVPNFILDIGNRSSNIEQSLGFQGYGESFDGYFYILLNIPSHFSHCYYRSWAGSDCQHFPDEASHNEMRWGDSQLGHSLWCAVARHLREADIVTFKYFLNVIVCQTVLFV